MAPTETDPDANRSWEAAAQLATGVNDDGLHHRRRVRALLWVGALVIGSWTLDVPLALLLPHSPSGGSAEPDIGVERWIEQFLFLPLGLLIGIVGVVWGIRSGHYISRGEAVISPLSVGEKRGAGTQIRGNEPVDTGRAATVLAVAGQGRRSLLGIVPIYAMGMLVAVGTAIGNDLRAVGLLGLFASLLFVAAAVLHAVVYRRIDEFVLQHNRPTTHAPGYGSPCGRSVVDLTDERSIRRVVVFVRYDLHLKDRHHGLRGAQYMLYNVERSTGWLRHR